MPSVMTRLWNALAGGAVQAVNDAGTALMAQIKIGYLETMTLPVLQQFGFSSVPPIGSDVVAHFFAGDRSNGVITGTNHQPSRPTGKKPGETMVYDDFGKQIYLTEDGGIIVNANNSAVTVNGATTLIVNASQYVYCDTPELRCSGDIIDNYGTNTHTMAGMRTIYNEHTHTQPDDSAGDTEQPTAAPSQLMD